MTPELVWAAGFFSSGAQVNKWRNGIALRIRRRDPEYLERFHDAIQHGAVLAPQGNEQRYTFRADNDEVEHVVALVRDHLSPGHLAKLAEVGVRAAEPRPAAA